jgi:N-carbamoyl-L-amino-acid hydrolase
MSTERHRGFALAGELLADIGARTWTAGGIDRPSYGEGETLAMDRLRSAALELGLEVEQDFASNLYLTLRGEDPKQRSILIGSHVDSVPHGGNFDGLAGVVAGVGLLADLIDSGKQPYASVTVMAIRGEENAWFGAQHIGSRAALGLLSPQTLDSARRIDSGRSLGDHMTEAGADLAKIRRRERHLSPQNVQAYFELHIEQGPVLVAMNKPVAIVSGIRGNARCIEIRCVGRYGHSGAVPMALRSDAVVAASRLVAAMADHAQQVNAGGGDLVLTFGRFFTNPTAHGLTTIPGEVTFSFDCRSHDARTMTGALQYLESLYAELGHSHGVAWQHADPSVASPCSMDKALTQRLVASCGRVGVEPVLLPSGAGHDAQDFIEAGIPAGMIFVRNEGGSHNPNEMMAPADFELACAVLVDAVRALAYEFPACKCDTPE